MVSRPHDEHRSFGPRRENFVRTSNFFGFLKELYKNKFKNLIRTSKFKLSFRGLDLYLPITDAQICPGSLNILTPWSYVC